MHLDEFVSNLLAGPECIFDFEGALKAFFEAYIKIGLATPFGFVTLWSDSFKLLDLTIVDFNYVTCPPVEPNLFDVVASFDHDSNGVTAGVNTLVLNAGPRAGNVLPGETTDGDESFTIDFDSGTNEFVVTGYDYEERISASGILAIWFDAGLGNDVITVTANVGISAWGFGGPGNDLLTGGKAANTLFGDSGSVAGTAGSDKLIGRKAADKLSGGGGNDIILGYGGSDIIDGGDGDDQLYGEDEVGDMVDFIVANPTFEAGIGGIDVIRGGDGGDRIVGGLLNDALFGDAGDDTLDGGVGDDLIEGGAGNDKIFGRDGNDTIYGDDIAKVITAGAIDVNADLIEGGARLQRDLWWARLRLDLRGRRSAKIRGGVHWHGRRLLLEALRRRRQRHHLWHRRQGLDRGRLRERLRGVGLRGRRDLRRPGQRLPDRGWRQRLGSSAATVTT